MERTAVQLRTNQMEAAIKSAEKQHGGDFIRRLRGFIYFFAFISPEQKHLSGEMH